MSILDALEVVLSNEIELRSKSSIQTNFVEGLYLNDGVTLNVSPLFI